MRHKLLQNCLRFATLNAFSSVYRPRLSLQPCFQRVYSLKTVSSLENKYSETDKIKILAHFNQKNAHKLLIDSALNEFLAKSIVEHQKNSGDFQTLSDILKVSGIGLNTLHVICEKIITSDISTENSSFFPKLDIEELSRANLIVAFDIDIGGLSWSLLDKKLNLIEWSKIPLFGIQQISHYGFKKKLKEINERLPVADVYILQKSTMRPTLQNIALTLALTTVETMLMTLLYSLDCNVVRCKSNIMGRFFGLVVGNERTSGVFIINQMLKGESEHECKILRTPKKYFLSSSKLDQNRLANSLLLALTYHSLVLSNFTEQDEYSDEHNIESVQDISIVEPNNTVVRLGEKLKEKQKEALAKMLPSELPSKPFVRQKAKEDF